MQITISGRPVPKKNNPRIVGQGRGFIRLIPSKAWVEYEKQALKQLMVYGNVYVPGAVHVQARYFLPNYAHWPDLANLMAGTGDLLETAGIIPNDRRIVSWNGSAIWGIDKANPRVEIIINSIQVPEWLSRGIQIGP